jgi:excisionase family DNA binding protein
MKKSHASLEFPVVIKQIKDLVVVSCPDFRHAETIALPSSRRISKEFVIKVTEKLAQVWLKNHLRLSELAALNLPCPKPSKIRMALDEKKQKPLTAPQLAKMAGVSADTIRRAIDRGELKSEVTSGGHRKISQEVALDFLDKMGFKN